MMALDPAMSQMGQIPSLGDVRSMSVCPKADATRRSILAVTPCAQTGATVPQSPFSEPRGADVRQQALRCDRADCIVEDCEQAVRGLRKGILLQHVPVRAGHLGAFAHGLRCDRDEVVA